MRTTLSSISYGTTLRCARVELIDDILLSYPTNALALREDLASEQLRTRERDTLVNVESFQEPQVTQIACRLNQPELEKDQKQKRRFQ